MSNNQQQPIPEKPEQPEKAKITIASMLTQMREMRGLSQRELARRAGVRYATVSEIESKNKWRFTTIKKLFLQLGYVAAVSLTPTPELQKKMKARQKAKVVGTPPLLLPDGKTHDLETKN